MLAVSIARVMLPALSPMLAVAVMVPVPMVGPGMGGAMVMMMVMTAVVVMMVMLVRGKGSSGIREHHHCDCQQHHVADFVQMARRSGAPAHEPSPLGTYGHIGAGVSQVAVTLSRTARPFLDEFWTEVSRTRSAGVRFESA
jgi:hypothetical protein